MTIHIIIPVLNNLQKTKNIIFCIRKQIIKEKIEIIVINDGSNDGTKEWLASQKNIITLEGDGTLYWGGAINLGVNFLIDNYSLNDWVIFINNDVIINEDYVQNLYNLANKYSPAAIGSPVNNLQERSKLISLGPKIDTWNLKVIDQLNLNKKLINDSEVLNIDALSGRGVIYSLKNLKKVGGLKPKLIPHYLADYELSLRVKKIGVKLLISLANPVYSDENFEIRGNLRKKEFFLKKIFSKKSYFYYKAFFSFWLEASNKFEILTLPIRLILFVIMPSTRNLKN